MGDSDDQEQADLACAEEAVCGTTHCLAGWLQVCAIDPKIRKLDTELAGILQAPVASKMFYRDGHVVMDWLKERKYVREITEANAHHEARKAAKAQS